MRIFRYRYSTTLRNFSQKNNFDSRWRNSPNPTAMDNKNAFNDRMIKLIGIPALGLFIPNISGLITNRNYSYLELLACYAYFTFLSFLVWQGNVWLMHFIRKKYIWSFRQYHKIIISLFLVNIVYSGSISALL